MIELNKIYQGNAIDVLKTFPDQSIDMCVTSPPYYGLRDYGTGHWVGGNPNCPHRRLSKYSKNTITGHSQSELAGNVGDAIYKKICPLCGAVRVDEQIGLEETPEEYINRLVDMFHEVKRVLKDGGTLWVNIGDTYSESDENGLKAKDMIGIPWMLAFALRSDGWYLRQDIIWEKPNPMPEPVKDRCVKSHEYIFLLSKSPKYYFDYKAIQEEAICKNDRRAGKGHITYAGKRSESSDEKTQKSFVSISDKRNKRDVWKVGLKPIKEAHFATFPPKLIEPCILAGCPQDGIVLDPFFGSGTTGIVAESLNRNFVGIELNQDYIDIAKKRLNNVQTRII